MSDVIKSAVQVRIDALQKKDDAINTLTYERELILGDIVNTFKTLTEADIGGSLVPGLQSKLLKDAWRWFNRKEKDAEKSFDVITDRIKQYIFGTYAKYFKLIEVTYWGYDQNRFSFRYQHKTRKKLVFEISVPNYSVIEKNNYLEMFRGLVLYEVEGSTLTQKFNDLNVWEFQKKFQGWAKEKLGGKSKL